MITHDMSNASPIGLLISNPLDAKLLRHFLASMGHGVSVLSGATEDLQSIADSGLIFVDEACAGRHADRLLKLKRTAEPYLLPILVLAGENADTAGWIKRGFDDVLKIPVIKTELMVRLETFLRLRSASQRAHREHEERFRVTFDEAPNGIAHSTVDGRVLIANRRLCEMLGYDEKELQQLRPADITFPDDIESTRKFRRAALAGQADLPAIEKRFRRKDGTIFWGLLHLSLARDDQGEPKYFISIISDISERKQLEAKLERVGRARHFMAQCNHILVHATTEAQLLEDMCREAVNSGGYRIAWVGMAQHDAGKTVLPVASAGHGADYVNNMSISWSADHPTGQGAIGRAIRSGELTEISDIPGDPELQAWQAVATEHGLRAVLVLPLTVTQRVVGGMVLVSSEVGATSADERDLLNELASDISYGIETLRAREVHARAVLALHESERFARSTIDALAEHICVLDETGKIIAVNRAWREFAAANGNIDIDCITEGSNYLEVCDQAAGARSIEAARVAAAIRAAIAGDDQNFSLEYSCHSSTEKRWFLMRISRFTGAGDTRVVVSRESVTQRRLMEESLRESEARFRSLTNLSSDWYWEQDEQFRFTVMSGSTLDMAWPHQNTSIGKTRREMHEMDPGTHYFSMSDEDWAAHQAMLDARQAFRDQVYQHRNPDGQVTYVSVSGEPVFDEHGVFKGYRGTGKDITAQKRVEQALRDSEERFRSLTNLSSDWYWEQDKDFRFTVISGSASAGAMPRDNFSTGKTRQEVHALMPSDYYINTSEADWSRHQAILDAHEPFRDQLFQQRGADGQIQYLSISGQPFHDQNGNFMGYRGVGRDLTTEKRAEHELGLARERMSFLLSATPAVIFAREAAAPFAPTFISDNLRSQFGYEPAEYLRDADARLKRIHPEDLLRVLADLPKVLETGQLSHEYRLLQESGKYVWVREEMRRIRGSRGAQDEIVGYMIDITEKKRFEEQLLRVAHYDMLTELPNRLLFYDRLKQALAQAERNQWNTGVLFIDLDRFKIVNDTLGHGIGDELLRQVSGRLKETVRPGDTVGRLGGDEFAVVLSALKRPEDARLVTQKIVRAFEQPFELNGREMFVTASIGIAVSPVDGPDPDTLIKNADTAMYRAKDQGRNNIQFYTPEMNSRALERLDLENSLRRALERSEFRLFYQPKVSTRTGKVVGLEALLRWERPGHGLVSPADFIPILEDTGLIVPVGEWVLRTACAQIEASKASEFGPLPIAVNLSARQLQSGGLLEMVRRTLDDSGVDPAMIELEITESSLMHNTEEAVVLLNELKKSGLRISIDDFGTGYSSLAYLKRFPVDTLKIDRSFVRDVNLNEDDAAIARAIVTMAHQLSLKVVAEGVETSGQLAFLVENGCDEAQGFLFSRPVPAENLQSLPAAYPVTE